jgi:regulator of sirC expression with transglutaminase-like and TPR domain
VRGVVDEGLFVIDPFAGKLMTLEELRVLHNKTTGRTGEVDRKLLEPAGKRQMLLRILTNLRAIYLKQNDHDRLVAVLERMAILAPDDRALQEELDRRGGRRVAGGGSRLVH